MEITTEKLKFYEELEKKCDDLSKQNAQLQAAAVTSRNALKSFKLRAEDVVKEVLERDYCLNDSMVDLCDSLGLDFPMQTINIEVELLWGATIASITDSNGDSVDWTV